MTEALSPPAAPAPETGRRSRYRRTWPRPLVLIVIAVLLAVTGVGSFVGVRAWQAHRAWDEAERALAKRDFTAALAHLERYLAVWPSNAPGHFLAARTARRAGEYDRAEEHLARCQQLGWNPEAIKLERYLSRAQRSDLSDDVETFLFPRTHTKFVLSSSGEEVPNPDAALVCEALAKGYMQTYRLNQVRRSLEAWIEADADNPQPYLMRANVRIRSGNKIGAMADLAQALRCDPENDSARLGLVEAQLEMQQADQALEHLRILRARQPDQPEVLLAAARYEASQDQIDNAKPLLDQILRDPRFREVLAAWRQSQGRTPMALSPDTESWALTARKLATLEGQRADFFPALYAAVLTERARLAHTPPEAPQAEAWLREAVALNPFSPQTNFRLFQCLHKRGKNAEAEKYHAAWEEITRKYKRLYEAVQDVAQSPRDAARRCEIAELFLELGQGHEGLRWLQSAFNEDPQFVLPPRTRAALKTYYEQSKDPAALEFLEAGEAAP
jgi:tetratricopeptide (TPR) repeat protein